MLRKISNSLKRRGVGGSLRRALDLVFLRPIRTAITQRHKRKIRREIDDQFDRLHGVRTGDTIRAKALKTDAANVRHATAYQAVYPQPFTDVVRQLPIDFEKFLFVDIGSGKGRAVLLASDYPFKAIVGIEFSRELHQTALENLGKYRSASQKCRNIELLCMDATEYAIPNEPTVFFLYNPFDAHVMAPIVRKVAKSLEDHPRPIFVVYFNPTARALWDEIASLEILGFRQPIWSGFPGQVVEVWTNHCRR